MSKQCCEWHDALSDDFENLTPPEDNKNFGEAPECGLAGMGTPSACCPECPSIQHFKTPMVIYYEKLLVSGEQKL